MREGCVEAGGELTGLPRVVANDLDGDGRYTGVDIERALHKCSQLGGCVLVPGTHPADDDADPDPPEDAPDRRRLGAVVGAAHGAPRGRIGRGAAAPASALTAVSRESYRIKR